MPGVVPARLRGWNPVACQQLQLKLLLQKAARTAFGKDHDFRRLLSVDNYQSAVPLRTYEDFWADYWKSGFPILKDRTWPGHQGTKIFASPPAYPSG